LSARLRSLKFAWVFVCIAFPCAAIAQVYQVGSSGSKNSQPGTDQAQSQEQSLGWGSNIQNARLARAAELALRRGDSGQAFDYAQRAAQSAPNDPQLWFLVGYAARLDHKYQTSVDAFSKGLRLAPSSLDGLSGLAQTYNLLGRSSDAERLLKQVIASNPGRREDLLLLGEIYVRNKDYSSALDWLNKAERLQADARSELLLALSYQQLKNMDLASHYFDLAKRRAPNNPDVERSLAGYYRELGHYSDAIASLNQIRNPAPDVIAELAFTYQLDGKPEDSAKFYVQAANAEPKALELQLAAAQSQVDIGSMDQANSFLGRAAGLDPEYYRLHAIRAEIAQLQERDEEAIREYRDALATLPKDPAEGQLYSIQLHMDLVALYEAEADKDAAQRELAVAEGAIKTHNPSDSDRAPYLRLRSLIKLSAGDADGALADIKQALAINAGDRNSLQLDGDILMKLGRTEDAIAVYKQVLVGDPNNRLALTSLGYASRAAGRDDAAENYFERLIQVDPSLYEPYLALGDLYTSRREYAKAQSSYGKGYAIAPHNALIVAGGLNAGIEAHKLDMAGVWFHRVTHEMTRQPVVLREEERYLSFEGRYQESAEIGLQAIKAMPRDRDVVVYLGYDFLNLGKYDDLQALTSKYLNILPKEPDIPLLAGYADKHFHRDEEARLDFTQVLQRDPSVVTAYVNRGYVLSELHQPRPAAADFESALQREPNDGEAHLGLAYADLDLHRPQAALRQASFAERTMGETRDVHVIRATAYANEEMLSRAAVEYRAALKFTPDDGPLHLGLGNTLLGQHLYRDAIRQFAIAAKFSPGDPRVYALMARSYASLQDKGQTLRYVALAEQGANSVLGDDKSQLFISTGEALSAVGDQGAALRRFREALDVPDSNRISVRLAIAQLWAQEGHAEDAERQIALGWMEAEGGETAPPLGSQFVTAADVFRSLHDYQLSQDYLQRAKAAGAPDEPVRIGLADNYLALGETIKAQAELSAISAASDGDPDYQFLLAQANIYRQEHQNALALTAFSQASSAEGEDQTAQQAMLSAGADEGFRVTPNLSLLSDFSVQPIFEDPTVYVLDSKLDASFAVPVSDTSLLPPPRSSIQTQWTDAFHLHLSHVPTPSGFFQVRNARGLISVPATNSIVNRNTTDYGFNFGLNPTIHLGDNVLTFNGGIQETIRRDSLQPVQMNQNLFRQFVYVASSSFFQSVSFTGYVIHETGPFTESNLHSRDLSGALDFRVGTPWGNTAFLTGWGRDDQQFHPENYEAYYTSSYAGVEHHFSNRLDLRLLAEDLRAWRVVGTNSGIAQDLRPAATVDFVPKPNWDVQFSTAYSSTRGFHIYDATQNGFSISYALPFRRQFRDESGGTMLAYPIRFSAGLQEETFFNFSPAQSEQFRPYFEVSIF
jgi:tetratricopeptide (TPR) repeat protein